ncbi:MULTISPECIES: alpha-D-ribose 1-methylphosphonate 5-triphosphate diphosphatase [unclassified Undibacterium]|uniref:alpha-D-ribose 1-methylphosphonate 5-triphosphate diphosphatase n=1 Tax=unclassified Undibacterium TaxID=2630295 RepID=UPI002AC9ECCE|nr:MULTISPECIES: alpha-D-ribose 1-methylphosphonate 5-triphosphate diphosphatase [unclassified Undibacterium]MEB0138973.1 alpha-D-ribose 1-methylphosphonate 5-triphosphate diphosphatase [Undibacterium sp. CCC2.1]MEB0171932.1 alpha-D-ribose 1-methylphosphonate 5-triphosphate diphosphatase [Undibacterium sp. CCC1.1]MEB0175873.1 alpha-D-ribose 1-methylphosphonate 5-triphosphate diphosphatase [Undibacterium sp. CCC3.4]MEB0215061.1 alpha-D-ribose 1-methylphosphonate 5-triphosphate diphosphatase [Und
MNLHSFPERLIRNARIVTIDQVVSGSVALKHGYFSEVSGGDLTMPADDWQGDYLLPGMVELHTDNLEKHLMPRPKVNWPILPSIIAHDAQIAAAGITTVLDAIAVGDLDPESVRSQSLQPCISGIEQARAAGLLRVDHFLHLRMELAEQDLLALFKPLLHHPQLKLVSLMDHTPGQRQWTDLDHYRTYVTGKRGWSQQKVDQMLSILFARQQRYVADNRDELVHLCLTQNPSLVLASHDDTTGQHVLEGVRDGVRISEFPTSLAAAECAREHGLAVVMGAPNCVRGGSHSGNVSAAELARHDLLDILSSDYVPASLLQAAFLLQEHGYSLPKAIATVSSNPARLLGLHDRGQIAPGLRADFLRVRVCEGVPVVLGSWVQGRQIW